MQAEWVLLSITDPLVSNWLLFLSSYQLQHLKNEFVPAQNFTK